MKSSFQKTAVVAAVLSLAACASTEPVRTSEVTRSQALTNAGFNHMQAKDYAGAKPYFDRALQIEPNLAMAHLDLGAVYQNTGEPNAATEQFHLAIANDTEAHDYPRVAVTTDNSTGTVSEIAKRNLETMRRAGTVSER